MKKMILCRFLLALSFCVAANLASTASAEPLRVFIRGGKKTHGPGAHDHASFLKDWTGLLNQRGLKASGAMEFPTAEQLAQTDVLVMYAQDGGNIPKDRRDGLNAFLKRGGGIVVIHTASVSADSAHWKSIIGGSWVEGTTRWFEGPMSLYYEDSQHPITKGVSNFDMDDEIYYDMDLSPDIQVLAVAYTPKRTTGPRRNSGQGTPAAAQPSVYDIQPQMWTYERTIEGGEPYRAFVSIPGHLYTNFSRLNYRAVLLRGIAWVGHRQNVDEFCMSEELASLRYPEGGPTAPDKAAVKLEMHPDFNISLVASEPLINKPINIDWDARGRMWVAETPEYPSGRKAPTVETWKDSGSLVRTTHPEQRKATDRISILIDTDGDGRADKKEVFYEGLELVTSFVFYKDGVIASAAPDIWLIRDTDGDGKAETVSKLYTGLGTNDTHAVINNLRWGFDGWIYATHGYSASDHVWNGDKTKDFGRITSGVVRFRPDGSGFEQYCSKGGNTWGLDIAWDNEVFFTQPTSGDLLNHVVMPESILARGQVAGTRSYKPQIVRRKSYPLISYEKQAYVQIDLVGSFTASAGCAIYDGGTWPAEWNYSYFTTEPTINIIHHEVVTPDGVSYNAHKTREPEFIAGRDMWFRPIETRIGPDGALYLCDFYNQAVAHNDTRGTLHNRANAAVRPDRDHYFGRIWRVDHKQARKIEVPNLAEASPAQLVKALAHPNAHVRKTAQRLITEKGAGMQQQQFLASFSPSGAGDAANDLRFNIHWQWTLHNLGFQQDPPAGLRENPAMLKNTLQLAMADVGGVASDVKPAMAANRISEALKNVQNPNARVSLEAILALGSAKDARVTAALVEAYPGLDDSWRQSAVIGLAAQAPDQYLTRALASGDAEKYKGFVTTLVGEVATKGNRVQIAAVVKGIADAPESADALKQTALETLSKTLNASMAPEWSADLQASFQKLLQSPNPAVPASALPLIGRWDKEGRLTGEIKTLVASLTQRLNDNSAPDEARARLVSSLLPVRSMNPEIVPAIGKLLGPPASPELQKKVVEALGASADPAFGSALAGAYGRLDASARGTAFAQILKRADWSSAFLDALGSGAVNPELLGPADFFRLRTHPDVAVAKRANELWTKARGETGQEKNALIAKFTPVVTQPGNAAHGKELFVANCATCHKLENLGNEVGPILTGMGAHGPAELLVHILDPNREVEPSYISYNIETKDGEVYDGILARENATAVTLRNAAGEKQIPIAQIKSRQSSGRSLMPEGFEALGGEGLRDLLTFVCASESRFRFVDLSSAFTADNRRGIYIRQEATYDTLKFRKFGPAVVEGVPFNVVDAAKTGGGKNLMVLKGGASRTFSKTMLPQKVEAKLGYPVRKLHFLGGVAGWGYPGGGEDVPVMKVTAQFADGQKEELIFKNGVEFADYIRVVDVPGSKLTEGIVTENQLRYFGKPLSHRGVVEKLVFESFDNGVAPTTVAVTAELPGEGQDNAKEATVQASSAPASATAPAALTWGTGQRILLVGGGSSHDYKKWFDQADKKTLNQEGKFTANYTEDPEVAARELANVDVAVLSVNKGRFPTANFRKALEEFANNGKGLVLLHPGVWYNWPEWPEYNKIYAGGGARGHDRLGEFEVVIRDTADPVTKGVSEKFTITDELYWFEQDINGNRCDVLAYAHSPSKNRNFPMVWTVRHPKARIACIALGHDEKAHDLPEFKHLLRNAVAWGAGKPK